MPQSSILDFVAFSASSVPRIIPPNGRQTMRKRIERYNRQNPPERKRDPVEVRQVNLAAPKKASVIDDVAHDVEDISELDLSLGSFFEPTDDGKTDDVEKVSPSCISKRLIRSSNRLSKSAHAVPSISTGDEEEEEEGLDVLEEISDSSSSSSTEDYIDSQCSSIPSDADIYQPETRSGSVTTDAKVEDICEEGKGISHRVIEDVNIDHLQKSIRATQPMKCPKAKRQERRERKDISSLVFLEGVEVPQVTDSTTVSMRQQLQLSVSNRSDSGYGYGYSDGDGGQKSQEQLGGVNGYTLPPFRITGLSPKDKRLVPLTPFERQWLIIKESTLDREPPLVLAVEKGYKYVFMGPDAVVASRVLGFSSYRPNNRVFAVVSVPTHRIMSHVTMMVESGEAVGVVRQTETAALRSTGLGGSKDSGSTFERKLTDVYTKATMISPDVERLTSETNSFSQTKSVAAIYRSGSPSGASLDFLVFDLIACVLGHASLACPGSGGETSLRATLSSILLQQQPTEALCQAEDKATVEACGARALVVCCEGGKGVTGGVGLSSGYDRHLGWNGNGKGKGCVLGREGRRGGKAVPVFSQKRFVEIQSNEETLRTSSFLNNTSQGFQAAFAGLYMYLDGVGLSSALCRAVGGQRVRSIESQTDINHGGRMYLSPETVAALELVNTQGSTVRTVSGAPVGSVLWLLDAVPSRLGARRLSEWLLRPLTDVDAIRRRQDIVEIFAQAQEPERTNQNSELGVVEDQLIKKVVLAHAKSIRILTQKQPDLERGVGRLLCGRLAPGELKLLLKCLLDIAAALQPLEETNDPLATHFIHALIEDYKGAVSFKTLGEQLRLLIDEAHLALVGIQPSAPARPRASDTFQHNQTRWSKEQREVVKQYQKLLEEDELLGLFDLPSFPQPVNTSTRDQLSPSSIEVIGPSETSVAFPSLLSLVQDIHQHYVGITEASLRLGEELASIKQELGDGSITFKTYMELQCVIEIPAARLKSPHFSIPSNYEQVNVTKTVSRFRTQHSKQLVELRTAHTDALRITATSIFKEIQRILGTSTNTGLGCQAAAYAIGSVAAFISLAVLARRPGWTKPLFLVDDVEGDTTGCVSKASCLEAVGIRHPVLEQTAIRDASGAQRPFVGNDVTIGGKVRENTQPASSLEHPVNVMQGIVLTGPNSGGKSVLLKTVALTVILAQLGCCVPADKCIIHGATFAGLVVRSGSTGGDEGRGVSTFFVEVEEVANFLRRCVPHSLPGLSPERCLVLVDELGRGTSTEDGAALAGATLRHVTELGCASIFTTHYTGLGWERHRGGGCSGIYNGHMAYDVGLREQGVIPPVHFLFKLVPGVAKGSYGLSCAQAAGIDADVLEEAEKAAETMKGVSGGIGNMGVIAAGLAEELLGIDEIGTTWKHLELIGDIDAVLAQPW